MTNTRHTANVLRDIMNSVFTNLNFTMEIGEDFSDGRLPTLDTNLWISNCCVMYKYFEKPMSTKKVIMRSSALSENTKISSLSQDMVRRMKTTSEKLDMKEKVGVIDNYAKKLVNSGYTGAQATKIITAGLKGYESALKREREGKAKIHTSAASGAKKRYRKKLLNKTNWYKQKVEKSEEKVTSRFRLKEKNVPVSHEHTVARRNKGEVKKFPVTTVLFVAQTPGGVLASRLREAEAKLAQVTGWKVKVVEKGGTTLKQLLHKSNPWAGGYCGRENCLPCKSGDAESDCFKRNILYESSCTQCKELGVERVYVGESARSSWERAAEHVSDYAKGETDSHMHKHACTDHNGQEKQNFAFKVVKTF